MADYADGGLIREASFKGKVDALELDQFKDEEVFIKGCADLPIPTWAFMMITAKVAQVADLITFGEEASPMTLFERQSETAS